jgi:23S rRNA (cytosine1962-C5)-methyltransferase
MLKPGEADRIVAGHPWIYQGAVLRLTQSAQDGDWVQVKDHRQRFLGVGFYNSKSKIHVRLLSTERVEPNATFFEERIDSALRLRKKHLPQATSFRVVNAESDFLSGLIVDKYSDVLVIQISSLGMERHKAVIKAVLEKFLSPRTILERSDIGSRRFEGLGTAEDASVQMSEPVNVELNGLTFATDLRAGHKTGLYLDQQLNYKYVAELAAGGQVLDCFSFMGGFGLHVARAGALHVRMLDQSEEAIQAARHNAMANGLSDKCSFETGNVFDWLQAETAKKVHEKLIPRWDVIILDPPSFTRNRGAVPNALRGYKEIHLRALKLLKVGGTLVTFCCSHHVNAGLFQDTVLSAAYDARRILRRVASYTQSPDHPVIPMIPETEYLKGFAYEVVR